MKIHFLFLVFVLLPVSCIQHQQTTIDTALFPAQEKVEVRYAEGFDVRYGDGFVELVTHSIGNNEPFADTVYLRTATNANIPANAREITPQLNSLACQSSTHLAFLDRLQAIEKVSALCGLEYVENEQIAQQLETNGAVELCMAEDIVLENLLKAAPDLFFTYPFGTEGTSRYNEKGITTLYIAEYLERSQLARLEWIKLFGLLLGKAKEANALFAEIEREYLALRQERPDTNLRFIMNLPYKDSWFMPSANSQTVGLVEDAGLSYFYEESGATENDVHSTEAVWNDAMEAEYWVIIASRPADYSLADLIAEEPVYARFKSVIHQQVIFCNTATTDYFAAGVVEPDVMLKDLLFATHKTGQHQPKYFFLLR